MRFAIFQGEKSVNDLATRLFGGQGRGSQAATKQGADALLKTNPQLKDISKVPAGSVIAIPDTAPPLVPGQEAIAAGTMREQVAQNVQAAFELLQKRLSDIDASTIDKVKAVLERVPSAELKSGMKAAVEFNSALGDPAADFTTIAKDAKELVKNVQAAQPARKQTLTALQKPLAGFRTR